MNHVKNRKDKLPAKIRLQKVNVCKEDAVPLKSSFILC